MIWDVLLCAAGIWTVAVSLVLLVEMILEAMGKGPR